MPKNSVESEGWKFMVDAAKRGLEGEGYRLKRLPGRGLSNVWKAEREGKFHSVSVRTTRDRWIAFPPLNGGSKWKTLDDVDLVAVAAVDSKEAPRNIEVYLFPARDVRQRFDAAYRARRKADQVVRDDFGMWVGLDKDSRGVPASVGSGIKEQYPPIAVYSIDELRSSVKRAFGEAHAVHRDYAEIDLSRGTTISEVMSWTRQRVSEIAGVRVEAVKLDLKIEY
jgi:hypothetical protein